MALADKLNKRVTIKRRKLTDVDGATMESWQDVCTVWCGVNVSGYRRFLRADAQDYEDTVLFTIRYRKDITVDMRIYYDGNPYAIIGIKDPNEAHIQLNITATTDLEIKQ